MKQIFHKRSYKNPLTLKEEVTAFTENSNLISWKKKKNYWVQTQKDASACVCLKLKCASCSVYSVV